jgi:4-hydroxy-tetrahydrodipicolinate reductase
MQTLAPRPAPHAVGTTSIGIYGSAGRMGRAIVDAIEAAGASLAGGVDAGEDPTPLARTADVLVDFSTASAIEAHLAAARAAGTAIVIGTTGLSPQHQSLIDAAATDIAVLQTGNTSLGVTLLGILVRDAAARLGADWDVEIVEMHHKHKVDAPSGTALLLGEAAEGTIGFASLRGGSVIGDHSVIFAGEGERIELNHRGDDRSIFARGAVRAAIWLARQPAGRYRMGDVLGL